MYIPVTDIKTIEVKNYAKVSFAGPLISSELTVFVNGDCNIDLKVTGKVNLVEGDSTEMIVKKFNRVKGRNTAGL